MKQNLINVDVLGDVIGAELPNKLRFAPIAKVDTKLESVAGDTIVRLKYAYIGDAETIAEGGQIPLADMKNSKQEVVIGKAGKGTSLTDEDVKRMGEGVVTEAKNQISLAIKNKIDTDCYEALASTKVVVDGSKLAISYGSIVDARGKFDEEDDTPSILFISPAQKTAIMKDPQFIPANKMTEAMIFTGTFGEIAGCQVVVAKKLDTLSTGNVINNLMVKVGALGIELAKSAVIEPSRVASKALTEYYGTEMYAVYLKDESKCVKLLSKSPVATPVA